MIESKQLKPEKIYLGFLKTEALINILAFFAIFSSIIIFMNSQFDAQINLFVTLPLAFILVVAVVSLRYYFNTKVYIGKIMAEGNQRGLKQIVYLLFPLALIADIFAIFLGPSNKRLTYILEFPLILFVGSLFYWRLRNKIKEEGPDNLPILKPSEIVFIIVAILFVIGLFYFLYRMPYQ